MGQRVPKDPISITAPTRVDLAGGTIDIPPLYLWHSPAPVVNAAISVVVMATVASARGVVIVSRDQNVSAEFPDRRALATAARRYPKLELLIRIVQQFPLAENISLEVDSEAPVGSGLGASSAIAIAATTALARWTGAKMTTRAIVECAKSAETQTIEVPTGYQDYLAAAYGGMRSYEMGSDGTLQFPLAGSRSFLKDFEKYMLVVYTGKPHFSGANNWELMKRRIDGDAATIGFFDELAKSAVHMRGVVASGDMKAVGRALTADWAIRKRMLPSMTTAGIERLSSAARRRGALGFRVCGAGGGGCALILVSPGRRNALEADVEKFGMKNLGASLCIQGAGVRGVLQ
jgi:D-glycero-alpha-D-manno-heptose-7-phosphate kinase